jgi:hypothetical protein
MSRIEFMSEFGSICQLTLGVIIKSWITVFFSHFVNYQLDSVHLGSKIIAELFPVRINFLISSHFFEAFEPTVSSWSGSQAMFVLCLVAVITAPKINSVPFANTPLQVSIVPFYLVFAMVPQQLEMGTEAV